MDKFYSILNVGAWVFLVLGVISFAFGIIGEIQYKGSIEEIMDNMKGQEANWKGPIVFGLLSTIISIIILIGLL